MKVGVSITRVVETPDVEATVARLEQAGVDSVWFPDHLLGYYHPEIWNALPCAQPAAGASPTAQRFDADAYLDPFCLTASLARQTKLTLGTCVTDGTRRRAADLLRSMLTLNQTVPGGFMLGIGAGEFMSLNPFGYDCTSLLNNLETTLHELRALIDTGHMPDGSGRVGFNIGRPQVWVAGGAPRSLKMAGRYGDAWFHLSNSADIFRQQYDVVCAAAKAAGRAAPTPALVPLAVLGESREQVVDYMQRWPGSKSTALMLPATVWDMYGIAHPGGPDCKGVLNMRPHDMDPLVTLEALRKVPMEMLELFLLLGNADEIAAKLQPLVEAGIHDIVFTDVTATIFPPDEANEQLDQYGRMATLLRGMAIGLA